MPLKSRQKRERMEQREESPIGEPRVSRDGQNIHGVEVLPAEARQGPE